MLELRFPMPLRRITVRRGDAAWKVEEESPLEGTLPAPLEFPDSQLPIVGSWWEAVDKDGNVLYRDRLEDVHDPFMEVFDEDGSISRVEHPPDAFAGHEPLMELLVPDLPDLTDIRFVRARSTGGRGEDGQPEIKQDVEVLHVGRGPRTRRGTDKGTDKG